MPKKPAKSAPKNPPVAEALVVVSPNPDALKACVEQIHQLDQLFHAASEDGKYVAVAYGVYLLKLRDIHHRDIVSPRAVRDEKTGQIVESEDGFYRYLEEHFCRQDIENEEERNRHFKARIRGFQRLMTAARNATLTGDHTIEDVQRIRALNILEGKSLTDLYKPVKQLGDKAPEPPPERNLCAEASLDLGRICGEIVTLRDQTDHDLYEANWHLLQATLEKYTGCKWSPVPDDYDAGEHGEVTFTAAPKKKKKKSSRKAAKSAVDASTAKGKGNK